MKETLNKIEDNFYDIYNLLYSNGTQEQIYKHIEELAKNAQQLKESFYASSYHK
jgi:uncharacterized membrane protein